MWYTIIDLKEFRCEIIKDKKVVADMIGISVPTLDKRLNGEGEVFLHDRFVVGKSELQKSTRGLTKNR